MAFWRRRGLSGAVKGKWVSPLETRPSPASVVHEGFLEEASCAHPHFCSAS